MAERGTGIPVVVAGLGEIGRAMARSVLEMPELRLVGAVDPDPALAGRRLDEVLETSQVHHSLPDFEGVSRKTRGP